MSEVIKTEKQVRGVVTERYYVCDKCGERIEVENQFDAFNCEFVYETGTSYPKGSFIQGLKLDLCQYCGTKAIDLLQKNGFKFQEKEIE